MSSLLRYKNIKVLLVDDSERFAKGAESYLLDCGIKRFRKCHDGVDALILAKKFKPDVILLDIIMPGMSGFEVMKNLKEANIDTKVVIFSTRNDAESGIMATKLGASEFIPKEDFFEIADLKIKNSIEYGTSILADGRTAIPIMLSNLDLLEFQLGGDNIATELEAKLDNIRGLLSEKEPDAKAISENLTFIRDSASGAAGGVGATAMIEVLSQLVQFI